MFESTFKKLSVSSSVKFSVLGCLAGFSMILEIGVQTRLKFKPSSNFIDT